MPYNLLLLPLLAGFIFLAKSHLFKYSTSQLQREQLLLSAALAGLVLALLSRSTCFIFVSTGIGLPLATFLEKIAPFEYLGTALGSLLLAYLGLWSFNFLVPERLAGFWLYHQLKFNRLETLLLQSAIGIAPYNDQISEVRLLATQLQRRVVLVVICVFRPFWRAATFRSTLLRASKKFLRLRFLRAAQRWNRINWLYPTGVPRPVMLTMTDGKIYVGLMADLPPVRPQAMEYIRILPIWSGYRDLNKKNVVKTTTYDEAIIKVRNEGGDVNDFLKVFPLGAISSAGLFVPDVFRIDGDTDHRPGRSAEDGEWYST